MKKILHAIILLFSIQVQAKMGVDFLIINNHQSLLTQPQINALISKKISYSNDLFEKSGLLIERKVSSISNISVPKSLSYLSLEVAALSTSELDGDINLFGDTAFSDKHVAKKVNKWLKTKPKNYKVILAPYKDMTMECGSTYFSNEKSFSVMYISTEGLCASDWFLAHELGHQDGISHSKDDGYYKTGICDGQPSVMDEGTHGERTALFGDLSSCSGSELEGSVFAKKPKTTHQKQKLETRW